MKDFDVVISLRKYLELDGELTIGQQLLCIDHYPCELISKRMKNYRDRDVKTNVRKLMHYKVKFLTDGLYTKGKIYEAFETELSVPLRVRNVDDIVEIDDSWDTPEY